MFRLALFLVSCLFAVAVSADGIEKPSPDGTSAYQKEKLNRGLVCVRTSSVSQVLSWRLLDTDDVQIVFGIPNSFYKCVNVSMCQCGIITRKNVLVEVIPIPSAATMRWRGRGCRWLR